MSKVYFKEGKDGCTVFTWDADNCNVLWDGGINKDYTKADFEHFTRFNYWILCNKDGSPIKTKNSVKRPTDNWKKTINKRKFDRCIKECVNLGYEMYYNPNTNCFYAKGWCDDDSVTFFKCNLSKVPESKLKFKEDVLTIYNEYLDEEMKISVMNSCHSREGDSELFEDLKESLEECVEIKKERENGWTDKHYDNYYTLTEDDIEAGKIRLDAYTVNRAWKINAWDDTGAAFHLLKTLPRIANEKNDLERELTALYKQVKCLCKLHNVEVE